MMTLPGFVEGDEKEDEIVLKKGDGVEANYGGKGNWFPGTISAVNEDGSYNVAYDKKSPPPHTQGGLGSQRSQRREKRQVNVSMVECYEF